MSRPLCVELFCGTFGWSAGWLARGGQAVGFDIEHEAWHGAVPAGAELVLQDVLTLHGSQFRHADLILASPPCQRYSYMAMPWSRAKAQAKWYRDPQYPERLDELNALFNACFRLQREASEAAGRWIPMVVENVVGAQKWVGPGAWHYGSYYLWGDVPALMPNRSPQPKVGGFSWSDFGKADYKPQAFNGTAERRLTSEIAKASGAHELSGIKQGGTWFHDVDSPSRRSSSKSKARRAASAAIARIPYVLSEWIAEVYWPSDAERAA